MTRPRARLTRAKIIRALKRLGELCAERQAKVELAIYGGTVMMFAYDYRAATRDIDAIFHPPDGQQALEAGKRCLVQELIKEVRGGREAGE